MKISTKLVKSIKDKAFILTFMGFPVFEIRKNLDLRKILVTPKIFLKSRSICNQKILPLPFGLPEILLRTSGDILRNGLPLFTTGCS